ncbi:hypothetical protein CBL_05521 [Carabus blaptoides fortunei]
MSPEGHNAQCGGKVDPARVDGIGPVGASKETGNRLVALYRLSSGPLVPLKVESYYRLSGGSLESKLKVVCVGPLSHKCCDQCFVCPWIESLQTATVRSVTVVEAYASRRVNKTICFIHGGVCVALPMISRERLSA